MTINELGRTECYDWFEDGRMPVDGDAHAHVRKSKKLCLLIDVLTVKEIAENHNVSVGSCHEVSVGKI